MKTPFPPQLLAIGLVLLASGSFLQAEATTPAKSAAGTAPVAAPAKPPVAQAPSEPAAKTVAAAAPKPQPVDFASHIQPMLEAKCLECHNPDKDKGGLLMHTAEDILKGGDSGASVVPGKPEESLVLQRVMLPHDDDEFMPPEKGAGGPLSDAEKGLLKRWISEGAVWPKGLTLRAKSPAELKAIAKLQKKLPQIERLEVFPERISIETKDDSQRLLVLATFKDATTMDVTRMAKVQIADSKVATLTDGQVAAAAAAGNTEIIATLGPKTAKAAVEVKDGQADRELSFRLDVMPVFMRGGCNQGGCHGAARGKDGFRISLFGMDPAGDYIRITREMPGRRVNLAFPEDSTLIEKSIGAVPHSGNQCFPPESQYNQTLIEWIKLGAPDDKPDVATVTGIDIFPKQVLLEGPDANQQIIVKASYSDGTDRDVTDLVLFSSNNDPVASINKDGLVTSGDRGAAFMMARFDVYTAVAQVLVIPDELKYERPELAEVNYIDELVDENLHKLRIVPSALCTDEEFIRRATIDIVGLYPKPEDIRSFIADANPKKREALVDSLLERKEFTELWVMKWAELLQIRTGINANRAPFYKNAILYHNWLSDRIAKNVPLNEIVVELLSATGGTVSTPSVNFYQMETDTLKVTENVAQVFMGMRIQCAQCHNHPFDRWTMDDYYAFNAFFTQIGRKSTDDPNEVIIYNKKSGESKHFLTQASMKPKFLGGDQPEIKSGEDRRKVLAEWLASDENPYFARNIANIIWAHFYGVGIVEPVDDVRITNPPSNPALMETLGEKLASYNYDFRKVIRDICTSMTYQRSTHVNETNAGDKRNFSHATVRRVRAEVLLDAISQITETPNKFQGLPLGARAVQIADGAISNYFLTTFGRAKRESVCSCEVKMEPTLSQALHLMNGDAVTDRIKQGKVVENLIAAKKSDREIVENLYLRVFGRMPVDKEWNAVQAALTDGSAQRQEVLEDVFWALLNSKEFYFNH